MWHVTRYTWHVTCCGGWTLPQNFSSLALVVCDLRYLEDWKKKACKLNNNGVCRTAPATPGLLITYMSDFVFAYIPHPFFLLNDHQIKQLGKNLEKYSYSKSKQWSPETLEKSRFLVPKSNWKYYFGSFFQKIIIVSGMFYRKDTKPYCKSFQIQGNYRCLKFPLLTLLNFDNMYCVPLYLILGNMVVRYHKVVWWC